RWHPACDIRYDRKQPHDSTARRVLSIAAAAVWRFCSAGGPHCWSGRTTQLVRTNNSAEHDFGTGARCNGFKRVLGAPCFGGSGGLPLFFCRPVTDPHRYCDPSEPLPLLTSESTMISSFCAPAAGAKQS